MVGWHSAVAGQGVLMLCALMAFEPAPARGQSLAAVARREQARRDAVEKPGKVYTNEDLRRLPSSPVIDEPAAGVAQEVEELPDSASASAEAASGESAEDQADEVDRDESYWQARIGAVRVRLQRNELFLQALESRVSALTTDFVNTDDPAERALVAIDRQKAQNELERVGDEVDRLREDIAAIEEEARRASVPPGWLR